MGLSAPSTSSRQRPSGAVASRAERESSQPVCNSPLDCSRDSDYLAPSLPSYWLTAPRKACYSFSSREGRNCGGSKSRWWSQGWTKHLRGASLLSGRQDSRKDSPPICLTAAAARYLLLIDGQCNFWAYEPPVRWLSGWLSD